MKIVVLGAGRVGESVAEALVLERNDITVIDTDSARLQALQDRLDLRIVAGNGILPSVLRDAGVDGADMLIACAGLDETNLVACKIGHDLFNVPTTIARVHSAEFEADSPLMKHQGFAVDQLMCPEQSVTAYVRKLIEYPEALQVLEFADGLVSLIVVRAVASRPLVQHSLAELPGLLQGSQMRIVAIYRGDNPLPHLDGATRIEPGDEVFILAATEQIRSMLGALRNMDRSVRRVMIAGGGRLGMRLARDIAQSYHVKVIEASAARCEHLASQLPDNVLILNGDSTDGDLLSDEQVADMDLFLALTNDDEDNIMSCLQAKRLGARRVCALIRRKAYADLVQGTQIDIAFSPLHAVIGELLAHLRRGDIEAVHSLRRGAAEALELVVRGDRKTCRVADRRIEDIKLPEGAQIGAIVRTRNDAEGAREVLIPHHDTVIRSGDHVVVFVARKRLVRDIEKLFEVSAAFGF